jgi:hypothetical protein
VYNNFLEELAREGYEVRVEQTGFDSELIYVMGPDGEETSIAERCNGRCEIYPVMFAAPGGNPPY